METSGIFKLSSSVVWVITWRQMWPFGQRPTRHVRKRRTLTRFDVQDHLQSLLVEGHQGVQTRQIEVVLDEFFRHLRKVFVTRQAAEPADPGQAVCSRRRDRF